MHVTPGLRFDDSVFKVPSGLERELSTQMLVRKRVMPDFSKPEHEMFTGRRPRAFQLCCVGTSHSRTGARCGARLEIALVSWFSSADLCGSLRLCGKQGFRAHLPQRAQRSAETRREEFLQRFTLDDAGWKLCG